MSKWNKIYERSDGGRRLLVEQDKHTGNITVHANIVELTPEEFCLFAAAMHAAAVVNTIMGRD